MKKISMVLGVLFLGALLAAPVIAADMSNQSGQTETVAPPQGASNPEWRTRQMQENVQGQSMMGSTASYNMKDKKVQTSQGEDIGKVEDVIVGSNGRVKYLIVSHGGAMGFGGKLTPVPWNVVAGYDEKAITLNVDKSRLDQAPTISENEYSQLNSPEWNQKVHSYYGEMGTGQGMKSEQPGMMERKDNGMKQKSE